MKLIVCLDDHNAMAFNNRRQSMDRNLRAQMLERCKTARLWMNAYSARQFEELPEFAIVNENFLQLAEKESFCFVEITDVTPFAHKIDSVIVYRWNRVYPADLYFPEELLKNRRNVSSREFVGSSHDRITEEIYE